MDRSVALRAALIQGVLLAVLAVALAASRCRDRSSRTGAGLPDRASGRRARRRGAVLRLPLAARARGRGARRAAEPDRRRCRRRTGSARRSASLLFGALVRPAGRRRARRGRRRRADGPRARGRVALVTGGSKGIGPGIAAGARGRGRAGRDRGARRGADREAAARIGAPRLVFDSGDLDAVDGVVDTVESRRSGRSTSTSRTPAARRPAPDPLGFTRAQWEAAHRTLVLSPMAFLERLLPGMRARGWGRVVAVGVDRGARADRPPAALQRAPPRADRGVQGARPAGRRRRRHAQHGAAGPDRHRPAVRDAGSREAAEAAGARAVPAGRLGTVDELAAAAVFLCSGPAAYITGTTLLVDGGLTRRSERARLDSAA